MCDCLPLGTWPTTQARALTGNPTRDPLVHRPALSPLSYTSQGWIFLLKEQAWCNEDWWPFEFWKCQLWNVCETNEWGCVSGIWKFGHSQVRLNAVEWWCLCHMMSYKIGFWWNMKLNDHRETVLLISYLKSFLKWSAYFHLKHSTVNKVGPPHCRPSMWRPQETLTPWGHPRPRGATRGRRAENPAEPGKDRRGEWASELQNWCARIF